MSHERHSAEREFDIHCDECHKRIQEKMRQNLIDQLANDGLSPEKIEEFLAEVDKIVANFKDRKKKS